MVVFGKKHVELAISCTDRPGCKGVRYCVISFCLVIVLSAYSPGADLLDT